MSARLALAAFGLALLAGCASPGGTTVRWVELDEAELQAACRARAERATKPRRSLSMSSLMASSELGAHGSYNACFEWEGSTCVIYTRKAGEAALLDPRFQQTFGHEGLHCFRGLYH